MSWSEIQILRGATAQDVSKSYMKIKLNMIQTSFNQDSSYLFLLYFQLCLWFQ